MKVMVSGGAGYIGSHTVVELVAAGHEVLVVDNHANSSPQVLSRLEQITGKQVQGVVVDIRDAGALDEVMAGARFDAVVHFAAFKSVGESWQQPVAYFDNNISGTISLLGAMARAGVRHLVFSSSATVYGTPDAVPIPESAALRPGNPYGRTKLMAEELIRELSGADRGFHAAVLRYFNPVGAHPSGRIGEDPHGIPNNLMPYVCHVAVGRQPRLNVFGNDYPTRDGTGVRDYVHVVDLARAHVRALERLATGSDTFTVNLGTGRGYSVLEVVEAFERASGRTIPVCFSPRRPGDVAECFASPALARELLGWQAQHDLADMCDDAWRWQSRCPDGYR
ncbi:MAG TPA: UDP-glucose 4-epimerase GalE [Stenotrophomonas sp.]